MKIIFIILMCLSFFGCSKNQKIDEIVQNTESEVIEIEEEIKVDEKIKTDESNFEKYRLEVSIQNQKKPTYLYVEFKDEDTYCFWSPFGGYLWEDLDYRMTENTISLSKFSNEKPFNIEELNNLFSASDENKFVDFVYDEDFCTFDFKGGYRNGKILITDGATETPDGTICNIGDIEVLKTSGHLVVLENLKVRAEPSINAKSINVNYYFELYGTRDEAFWDSNQFNEDYVMAFENVFYDERIVIPVLLAGKIKHFDAVTVKKDTIDGITAPWYRVNFVDEVASMDYWIFGGYVKEIEDPFTKEYEKLLCESAVQKGLLIPVAKIEEENKKLQTQALNVYGVGDLLRPNRDFIEKNATATEEVPHYYTKYYLNGNCKYSLVTEYVNNDLLQDSPIKIGMTKQEIIDLWGWGEPYKETETTLEYNTYAYSEGAGYEFLLELENDVVVKIVCTIYK